jgi:hypothetical protein
MCSDCVCVCVCVCVRIGEELGFGEEGGVFIHFQRVHNKDIECVS